METCWSCAAAMEPGESHCRICGVPASSIDPTLVQPVTDSGPLDATDIVPTATYPAVPLAPPQPPADGHPPQPGDAPPTYGYPPPPAHGYAPPQAPAPSAYGYAARPAPATPAYGYAARPAPATPAYGYAPQPAPPPPAYGYAAQPAPPPPGYGYAPGYPAYPVAVIAPPKSKAVAALLCFFLGGFGIHRFYTGQAGLGVALLLTTLVLGPLTLGLWYLVTFIWVIVDFVLILSGGVDDQYGRPLE